MNIPASDGQLLYDIIVENGYYNDDGGGVSISYKTSEK